MKALVYDRYGGPEALSVADVDAPEPGPGEIAVRVRAASLNGADAEMLVGVPVYGRLSAGGLSRPRVRVLGSDVAGIVEAVGAGVDRFAPGDAVVGELFERFGALAERVCGPADRWVRKPDALGFEAASTVPQAGILALQAMELVPLGPGGEVLVVGAGGGVGVFAVQLAKARGARVTAVDNGGKAAMLRELGADRVIDHTREDALADGASYDLIVDAVAVRGPSAYRRALRPGGACTVVGGSVGRLLAFVLYGLVLRLVSTKRIGLLMWDRDMARVQAVLDRMAEGAIRPVIDGVFTLDQGPAAFRRLMERRANGKVVFRLE